MDRASRRNMKYIKIKGHDNWFLVLEKGKKIPDDLNEIMHTRMFRKVVSEIHNPDCKDEMWADRVKRAAVDDIDYQKFLDSGDNDILVRPFGSWMHLPKDMRAQRVAYSDGFPPEKFGTIVICENDADPSWRWVEYLTERFPKETIETIPFFDTQSDKHVREYFKHARYVTFSTTFTSYDWWKKLVRNLYKKNEVIGYCGDKKNWEEALKTYSNVEVIKTI